MSIVSGMVGAANAYLKIKCNVSNEIAKA